MKDETRNKLKPLWQKIEKPVYFIEDVFCNIVLRPYITVFGRHDKRRMKYYFSLCLIFRDEAPFLKEWIDYHSVIGVDHFYLYNNESSDNFREVLAPYIEQGRVTLIDFPGSSMQVAAYKDCWERFRGETNWMCFLDADEFICPKYETDIKNWVKGWDKWPAVEIKWVIFGTSGLVKHDFSKGVIEQYTSCTDKFWTIGKCFVNTRFDLSYFFPYAIMHYPHVRYRIFGIKIPVPPVNQFRWFIHPKLQQHKNMKPADLRKATIQINHYYTKSWEELARRSKKPNATVYENGPSRQHRATVLAHEEACVQKDYTIQRFLLRLRIAQGKITDLPFKDEQLKGDQNKGKD